MLIWVLILCLVLFIYYDNQDITSRDYVNILGYTSKYFYMSHGESKKMFEKMENDNIAHESLKSFVMMEDEFLNLERISVCSGISQKVQAFALSDEIKNKFKGYDFSYHAKHLKQISEPDKVINRNIKCSSDKT